MREDQIKARHAELTAEAEGILNRDDGPLTDNDADRLETIERSKPEVAEWAVVTSQPAYASAFAKFIGDPQSAAAEFTAEESRAFRAAKTLERALNEGNTTSGGAMVPTHLDPAILLHSNGSINPVRQVARVVTIGTKTWNGVTSAGVVAEYATEAAVVSDGSPTLIAPSIDVERLHAWVPYSWELVQDVADLNSELGILMADAVDQAEATAQMTGSGTNEPTGIVTALAGTASQVAHATNSTISAADVYGALEAVPPRFRANASWMIPLEIINKLINQFGPEYLEQPEIDYLDRLTATYC